MYKKEKMTTYTPTEYTVKQIDTMFAIEPIGVKATPKFACFDMDWTLSYGDAKLYPSDPVDIHVLPNRRKVLRRLVKQGYSIIIFTNQYAVSKKERAKRCDRVKTFLKKVKVPCWVFVATGKDKTDKKTGKTVIDPYRKPMTGMWSVCTNMMGSPKVSFFCGDAAGRPQDFSDSDKEFAKAIGIDFKIPEELFSYRSPTPRTGKELVVFVGMPGCGKTTIYHEKYSNYTHINQDRLKTSKAVFQKINTCVENGNSMVIDATNGPLEKRKSYYDIVANTDYKITVVYFARNGKGWNDLRENRVPTIAYHKFFKHFVRPNKLEIPQRGKFLII